MNEIEKLKIEEFDIRREMGKHQGEINKLQERRMQILKQIDELEIKVK